MLGLRGGKKKILHCIRYAVKGSQKQVHVGSLRAAAWWSVIVSGLLLFGVRGDNGRLT